MATNEELDKLIDGFNKQDYKNHIKVKLSNHVDYITFCNNDIFKFNSEQLYLEWNNIFLLKKDEKYVGIIEDGSSDLHIYVQPKFRKKTNLIEELNGTIIPYLLISRKQQKLTFVNEIVESYFLNSLNNIKKTDEKRAVIAKVGIPFIKSNNEFSEEDFSLFKSKVLKAKQTFKRISKFSVGKPACDYLINQPYVNDSDFSVLRPKELINFTKDDFDYVKKSINYFKKLTNFYEKQIELIYDVEKLKKFSLFFDTHSEKSLKALTLDDFSLL